MSHFSTIVFTERHGRDLESLMAPYDEGIAVAPYIKYTKAEAIAISRKEVEEDRDTLYAEYMQDPEAYKEKYRPTNKHLEFISKEFPKRLNWSDKDHYNDIRSCYSDEMVDTKGNLYSTYNPNSKYDYYGEGNVWLPDGFDDEFPAEKLMKNGKPVYIPFAFVTPNGIWHERGKMGWFAFVSDEKEQEVWENEFVEALKKLKPGTTAHALDCHI